MKLSLVLLSVTESQHSLKKAEPKQGVLRVRYETEAYSQSLNVISIWYEKCTTFSNKSVMKINKRHLKLFRNSFKTEFYSTKIKRAIRLKTFLWANSVCNKFHYELLEELDFVFKCLTKWNSLYNKTFIQLINTLTEFTCKSEKGIHSRLDLTRENQVPIGSLAFLS